jgi:hypothetical protein
MDIRRSKTKGAISLNKEVDNCLSSYINAIKLQLRRTFHRSVILAEQKTSVVVLLFRFPDQSCTQLMLIIY